MEPKFLEVDRETLYLLPPSVQDWLYEGTSQIQQLIIARNMIKEVA